MRTIIAGIVAIGLATGITGCAGNTPKLSDASTYKVDRDKTVIRVHRLSSMVGALRSTDVYDNNKLIGEIKNDSVLEWTRPAGQICLHTQQELNILFTSPIDLILDKNPNVYCFMSKPGGVEDLELNYFSGRFNHK